MRFGNRGNILIYAILLANFAIILAYLIFTKSQELSENSRYSKVSLRMSKNIEERANSAIDYDLSVNKDGGIFVDTRTCPSVSMSGTLSSYAETITTQAYLNGTLYSCSGSSTLLGGKNLLLTYSSSGTSFSSVNFGGVSTSLAGSSTLTGILSDSNGTYVSLSNAGPMSGIDLNGNSDNYMPNSTGTVAYPNGYVDNDDTARKIAVGYARQGAGWYLAYWNPPALSSYIRKNSNNTGSLAAFPDTTSTGYLRLDVDQPFSIRINEFNSGAYVANQSLIPLSTTGATFTGAQIGYLQNNLTIASGTGSAMPFNLAGKNYGVFLSGSGSTGTFFRYRASFYNQSGSLVYTVPIDDSDPYLIKYLGGDILIDDDGHYVVTQKEVTRPK